MTSQAGLVPAIDCTITAGVTSGACSQSYPWGTSVTLTGSGTGGSTFSGWSGACAGSGTCPVSMTQARSVTAAFIAAPQTLTVTGGGAGSGTVTSQSVSPAINCTITHGVASGTCSQSYPLGTPVTLAASPTGGATFSGWSGACTAAAGTCSVTMSQARNVIAGFGIGALTLSSLTPARGRTAGGTAVDVIGQAFVAGATTVSVGGMPATHVAVRSPTRLSFVTPAGPAGSAHAGPFVTLFS